MKCCNTCKFSEEIKGYDEKIKCTWTEKWPDSAYSRGGHFKRDMHINDGRNCPCYEELDHENT